MHKLAQDQIILFVVCRYLLILKMTINSGELIKAVSVVADKHNIRVTVKTSAKYSLIVAGSVFLGGMLMVKIEQINSDEIL